MGVEGIELKRPLRLERGGASWPRELEGVQPEPEQLWLRGRTAILELRPRVAVVGSRSPSPYGEAQALRFGAALARAGACVVSGMARGVDQAAHEGALEAGGATIAVLGSGVDRPWPTGPVCDRILEQGLLLSEHQLGSGPRRHHFPLRNRLISGLSQAILVVEAAHASGSLITARWAADQGRAVFVVPGRVDHPMARGCLRLLREGAQAVESPAQLLEDLLGPPSEQHRGHPEHAVHGPLPGHQETLLGALQGETLTVDELSERLGPPAAELVADLVRLELHGRVLRSVGGLYRLR